MRRCLGYSEVYCDARKRWLLAWKTDILRIAYYIFHILIPKSVLLVLFTFAPTSFDDTDLKSVIYRLQFWSLPRW